MQVVIDAVRSSRNVGFRRRNTRVQSGQTRLHCVNVSLGSLDTCIQRSKGSDVTINASSLETKVDGISVDNGTQVTVQSRDHIVRNISDVRLGRIQSRNNSLLKLGNTHIDGGCAIFSELTDLSILSVHISAKIIGSALNLSNGELLGSRLGSLSLIQGELTESSSGVFKIRESSGDSGLLSSVCLSSGILGSSLLSFQDSSDSIIGGQIDSSRLGSLGLGGSILSSSFNGSLLSSISLSGGGQIQLSSGTSHLICGELESSLLGGSGLGISIGTELQSSLDQIIAQGSDVLGSIGGSFFDQTQGLGGLLNGHGLASIHKALVLNLGHQDGDELFVINGIGYLDSLRNSINHSSRVDVVNDLGEELKNFGFTETVANASLRIDRELECNHIKLIELLQSCLQIKGLNINLTVAGCTHTNLLSVMFYSTIREEVTTSSHAAHRYYTCLADWNGGIIHPLIG